MTIAANVYRKRTSTCVLTIAEYDGDDAAVSAGDVVRVKIGTSGKTPLLDVGSDAPTANGSSTTAANPTTLVLHEDDLTMDPGVYDLEVAVYDASQTQIKHADKGVITVHQTMRGEEWA